MLNFINFAGLGSTILSLPLISAYVLFRLLSLLCSLVVTLACNEAILLTKRPSPKYGNCVRSSLTLAAALTLISSNFSLFSSLICYYY